MISRVIILRKTDVLLMLSHFLATLQNSHGSLYEETIALAQKKVQLGRGGAIGTSWWVNTLRGWQGAGIHLNFFTVLTVSSSQCCPFSSFLSIPVVLTLRWCRHRSKAAYEAHDPQCSCGFVFSMSLGVRCFFSCTLQVFSGALLVNCCVGSYHTLCSGSKPSWSHDDQSIATNKHEEVDRRHPEMQLFVAAMGQVAPLAGMQYLLDKIQNLFLGAVGCYLRRLGQLVLTYTYSCRDLVKTH